MITKLPAEFYSNRSLTWWDMAFWKFLLDEVCALSGRFLSISNLTFLLMITKLPAKFHQNRLRAFWDITFWKFLLDEVCALSGDFCQHRTWPSFYDNQASCQMWSKSVENFLSYLDHKQKDQQKNRLTRVKQYLSPKHSLGRGNKTFDRINKKKPSY